jgi:hypothetical protein
VRFDHCPSGIVQPEQISQCHLQGSDNALESHLYRQIKCLIGF